MLTRIRLYCEAQGPEQSSTDEGLDTKMEEVANEVKKQINYYSKYSNEQKLLFVFYNRVKLFNAAKSDRLAGRIAERTAQKRAKKLKEDNNCNILEKQTNKVNRPKVQLEEKHKIHLIKFYDDYPQARVLDAAASLTEKLEDFTLKETSAQNFLKKDCNLSFKKITLYPAPRNDSTKIANHITWVGE